MSDEANASAPAVKATPSAVVPSDDAPAAPATNESTEPASAKPAESTDIEMKDATTAESAPDATATAEAKPAQAAEDGPGAAEIATPEKFKARRKSAGVASSAKKLNKKASKARILHLDAKPGDHFFVKLKGFPQWPAIICDEDMLPQALLTSRPVTARRADGTYRDDYADGGKRAGDRTFPVMYLHTNEFGWVPNSDLIELDPETVLDVKMDKMRKDLQAAHKLAAENHPLQYFKGVLQEFQEDLLAKQKAKEAKAATPKKKKKEEEAEEAGDEDEEMADADDGTEGKEKKSSKKRKAEENIETPQRSDSVKKPKIKLTSNSTPKANGSATPKSAKAASEAKNAKSKPKKVKEAEDKKSEKEPTPKEPELSPEEKRQRKEKEVLFLRHKLQKGLLTRDHEPKEEEMNMMSEYITKLEGFPDLEVSIIRATKINKVLKAILKIENIPKEPEFKFRTRSQVLLDKWNKLLADGGPEPATAVNGTAAKEDAKTNGVKDHGKAADSEKPAAKQTAKSATPSAAEEKKEPEAVKS